jgi:amino acid transporter
MSGTSDSPGARGISRLWSALIGGRRNVLDPAIHRHLALIAFFAWVGLGSDGLSSSCYGPEEVFRQLGEHRHLALYLVAAMVGTVFLISASYSQIIEQFPSGGGGYLVATRLLGSTAGVISGSALVVDYVLTVAISVAAGCDAIFSFLPAGAMAWKLAAELTVVGWLIVLNLRGVKESVMVLTPIFLVFLLTHALLIGWGSFAMRAPSARSCRRRWARRGTRSRTWGCSRSPRSCCARSRSAAARTPASRP